MRIIERFVIACLIYLFMFTALGAVHDYPQLRRQMHKVRMHDQIAQQRQWVVFFYLVNESASGIKFFLTKNEKHFRHFPSPSHQRAARFAKEKEKRI